MATDPVCGMEVDPEQALSASYQGEAYYFCAEGCREKFSKEPGKYATAQKDGFLGRVFRPR